jgi:hypothetical protein
MKFDKAAEEARKKAEEAMKHAQEARTLSAEVQMIEQRIQAFENKRRQTTGNESEKCIKMIHHLGKLKARKEERLKELLKH